MEAFKELFISVIRTVIMPLVAGGVGQLLVLAGAEDPSGELRAAVASVIAILWYLLARWLETKNPMWGLMLLVAVQPNYEDDGIEDSLIESVRRTVVPLVVGWAITMLAEWGFDLDQGTLTLALQTAITTGYYALIRVIEQSKPAAGKLIGGVAKPTY